MEEKLLYKKSLYRAMKTRLRKNQILKQEALLRMQSFLNNVFEDIMLELKNSEYVTVTEKTVEQAIQPYVDRSHLKKWEKEKAKLQGLLAGLHGSIAKVEEELE